MSRPRIGVTGATRQWDSQTRTGVNAAYVRAVLLAGGVPILLVPELSPDESADLFNDCDGLLLTGGEDIDPACYGAKPHPKLDAVDTRRDANELAVVGEARAREVPILAICRGIQLLNVAFGGTLIQDIPSQRKNALDHYPKSARDARTHVVNIKEDSRLGQVMGGSELSVNSFHHQAVDTVGSGLVVTARSPDQIIEGIESADPLEWVLGVQWHPEELATDATADDLRLFSALVKAARRE